MSSGGPENNLSDVRLRSLVDMQMGKNDVDVGLRRVPNLEHDVANFTGYHNNYTGSGSLNLFIDDSFVFCARRVDGLRMTLAVGSEEMTQVAFLN